MTWLLKPVWLGDLCAFFAVYFLPMLLVMNWSFFWRTFIATIQYSSSCLRCTGTILSSDSNASVVVDFIALKISIKALFWAASKNLWCLFVYNVDPQTMLPYSNLEQIKDLEIWTASSGRISGNSVNLLYAFLHLLVMYSMWGVKVRFSSMIMPSTCWEETFLRVVPWIVNGICGGAGVFFLLQKIMYIVFMVFIEICHLEHQVWRLIMAICMSSIAWKMLVCTFQNSSSAAYLDSLGSEKFRWEQL